MGWWVTRRPTAIAMGFYAEQARLKPGNPVAGLRQSECYVPTSTATGSYAMNADALRELVRRQPFEPLAIHLSSGEVHEVRHPECIAIGKTRVAITDPARDSVVVCNLLHVTSVEFLQTT